MFYFQNIFKITDFIKEVYELDYSTNIQAIPDINVKNKEIFRIELYTPLLKGLSFKDLQFAFAFNSIDFSKFDLIPLTSEENYKREVRQIEMEIKNKQLMEELKNSQGSRFKNKYDALV